jgi:N-acetylglucosamine kinase-like BadF-type ATPase
VTRWAAVDGGQSAVRVRLSWSDEVLSGPGFSHGIGRVEGLIAAVAEAVGGRLDLDGTDGIDVVAMGHTGMPVDEAERTYVGAELRRLFSASEARLSGDTVTAHAGALDGGPGVVVSAGTGAVCLAVGSDGASARVDGWGHLFGDAGGAFSIGRSGIEAAMRHFDGRTVAPALYDAARTALGADLVRATWDLYADAAVADRVARFAPVVIELADTADEPAREIVAKAAGDLAASVAAATSRVPGIANAVSYTGRLLSSGSLLELFLAGVVSSIPDAHVLAPVGDPLAGAARFAHDGPGIHSSLVHIYRGSS